MKGITNRDYHNSNREVIGGCRIVNVIEILQEIDFQRFLTGSGCKRTFTETNFNRDLTDKTCMKKMCVIFREKSQEVVRLRM